MLKKGITSLRRCICQNLLLRPSLQRRFILTLAIETSCDDTCVALLEKHESTSHLSERTIKAAATLYFSKNVTSDNVGYKGIHPIESLDSHRSNLAHLINEALLVLPAPPETDRDGSRSITLSGGQVRRKPDFISVTRGPGMRSNLACGLDTAKGLAVAWQIPLVAVHHMQAHMLTPRLIEASNATRRGALKPEFPFFSLLLSGGHTMLLWSESLTNHSELATTADIAIGDALDKIGRLLLPPELASKVTDTAFAKHLSEYAFPQSGCHRDYSVPRSRWEETEKPLNECGWAIQGPLAQTTDMRFSFGGLVSRVNSLYEERQGKVEGGIDERERRLFAQTAVGIAFEHLTSRTIMAMKRLRDTGHEFRTVVVSGGVAANTFLRHFLRKALDLRGFEDVQLYFPPPKYCTDNAAMIGWAGIEMFESGWRSDLSCRPVRRWSMDSSLDGGITGIDGWNRRREDTRLNRALEVR